MQRLVLFDIDETMISSDGAGRRAIGRILRDRHAVQDEVMMKVSMSGKTDPQIIREVLLASDIAEEEIERSLGTIFDRYLEYLEEEIASARYYIVHEGVYELLDALINHADIFLGLLTGNVEAGARLKLDQFGLNKHFPIGAYGSDSGNRLDLPAIACQRAETHYRRKFAPQDLVIIGDSVNDILCAHHFEARCIAVNSGKTSWQELEALAPAYLLKSLQNTAQVIEAILAPASIRASRRSPK